MNALLSLVVAAVLMTTYAPNDDAKAATVSEPTAAADAAASRGDYFTAQTLYRELAKKGNIRAQYRLGFLLSADNPAEARIFYRLAAEQEHSESQFRLGIMLLEGRGGPVDKTEATKWLERAAAQGNLEAKYRLGQIARPVTPTVTNRGAYGSDPERCKYLERVYFACRDRNGASQCKVEDDARWACASR